MNEDPDFLLNFIEGDPDTFSKVVRAYQEPLRSYLFTMCAGDIVFADELAQETFLSAFKNCHKFRGDSKLSTWLFQIAKNKHRDLVKSSYWKNRSTDNEEANLVEDNHSVDLVNRLTVQKAVESMSDDEKNYLALSYIEGQSHRDIMGIVNLPLGTVKSKIQQAREKFKRLMETNS